MTAFLRGQPVDVLEHLGPGLAPRADAPPIPASAWNGFALELGARLLVLYAGESGAKDHVIEIVKNALATVAGAHELIGEPEIELRLGMLEATLRPMTMFARSPAAEIQLRIFRWGMRRIRRERHLHDSLADLARDAASIHAERAALRGEDGEAARAKELAQQRADALAVLS